MSENTRKIFMDALIDIAKDNDKIVVLDPDVGEATYTWNFGLAYPDRFYEFGIAEQNTFGVASGLASTGLIVIASTFAVFSSMRACEMVRTYICYPKRNVKIIGGYAGISNGKDGATHQSVEDMAIMRSFSNMVVMAVSDMVVAKKIAELAVNYVGPMYLRMEYEEIEPIHSPDLRLEVGKGYVVKEGSDITIVSYGTALHRTMKASEVLDSEGISAEIIDMPTLKPFDEETLVKSVQKTGRLVTLEEHNIYGGLASAAAEILIEAGICPKFKRLGINDIFTESGATPKLRNRYKLDQDAVVEAVKNLN